MCVCVCVCEVTPVCGLFTPSDSFIHQRVRLTDRPLRGGRALHEHVCVWSARTPLRVPVPPVFIALAGSASILTLAHTRTHGGVTTLGTLSLTHKRWRLQALKEEKMVVTHVPAGQKYSLNRREGSSARQQMTLMEVKEGEATSLARDWVKSQDECDVV